MSPTTSRTNHLETLQHEQDELENLVKKLSRSLNAASAARRARKDQYKQAIKKLDQIYVYKRDLQAELWNAVLSDNPKRLRRAEANLCTATDQQSSIQQQLPTRLKSWAAAIKHEAEAGETLRDARARLDRKREEAHVLRPCRKLRCGHCRPGLLGARVRVVDGARGLVRRGREVLGRVRGGIMKMHG